MLHQMHHGIGHMVGGGGCPGGGAVQGGGLLLLDIHTPPPLPTGPDTGTTVNVRAVRIPTGMQSSSVYASNRN